MRLSSLESYELLDTPEETTYDSFASFARQIAETEMASISFVDDRREFFKAHIGCDFREIPRDDGFAASILSTGSPLVVFDASADTRYRNLPMVKGTSHVRFYAAIPLHTPDGLVIGALSVFDSRVGKLTQAQRAGLESLAVALMAVLEGRRRMLTIIDSAHVDAVMIEPLQQTVVFASRGACERLGYTRREMVGMPIFDILPAITESEVGALMTRARSGGETLREAELRRRDGSLYPVEVHVHLLRDGADERVLVIAIDLTQRKLQQTEIQLLLGAINVAGDVILVYDVDERGELHLAYTNDAFVEQSGYTREEAIGKTLAAFRQAMPDDEGMRAVRSAIADGRAISAEIVSYRQDGTTYWNKVTLHPIRDGDGKITHWISIERDITEEVAKTSVLAEEHDRLLALTRAARRLFTALDARTLVSSVSEVINQLLIAEGRVLAVREDGASVQIEDLNAVEWRDAATDELVMHAMDAKGRVVDEALERAVAYAGRFGENRFALELRVKPTHPLRPTDLFVFDLVAEYFAVAARNVSLYLELDERRSAVLELNQTKSDLIAMLAHDFRGPLTSIVGFADLTSEVGEVNEEQREFLETIKRSALQLSELATDTLTLARLERNEVALQLGEVDIATLLRSIIAQYADRRAIILRVSGDASMTGDDDRLRQVFANLIDNAVKYPLDMSEAPEVKVEGTLDTVVVKVIDHGIGIPAGEISRVFDRFSRATNARRMRIQGTGFGLFLTKQLVALHGGTIAVDSNENTGSTFTVTLPRRVDKRAAPRTVVVFDRDRDRSFLAYGLQEAGYRVIAASTLEEVLAIADGQAVDVLIIAEPEQLNPAHVVQFRAFSRERNIPVIAIANEVAPRLSPAVTLQRPVLIGDVVAALERLLSPSS